MQQLPAQQLQAFRPMSHTPVNGLSPSVLPFWTPPPAAALAPLVEAYQCARQLGEDVWEFALELRCLREAGLTHNHVRWLLAHGWVAQAVERSQPARRQRAFRRVANLSLVEQACFVLTRAGAEHVGNGAGEGLGASGADGVPCWDAQRRELRVGRVVVKRYRQPAPNQELVLRAFEEDGWPPRIDDPLPPEPEQDTKRRLHSTINNLNRSHEAQLIHFHGGGDAQSFSWRLLGESPGDAMATPGRV